MRLGIMETGKRPRYRSTGSVSCLLARRTCATRRSAPSGPVFGLVTSAPAPTESRTLEWTARAATPGASLSRCKLRSIRRRDLPPCSSDSPTSPDLRQCKSLSVRPPKAVRD